jgi:hypothetical protein
LISAKGWKEKGVGVLFGCTVVFLTLPTLWVIGSLKEHWFVFRHQDELESIAKQLLAKRTSVKEANRKLVAAQLPVTIQNCDTDQQQAVLFELSGIVDNCYGLAYVPGHTRVKNNCCGDLVTWENISGAWYSWTTT